MKIYIGDIVDTDLDLFAEDDICPSKFRNELEGISEGEDIELEVTSLGGSVLSGNAIISQIREAQANGHKVVAKVHGIAASMGSAIACSADELVMDANAVMMIHQPWTMVMGNQNDLRKEANTLDLLSKTLISVYRTKFPSKSDEEISAMMDAETWILATEAEAYGLVCEVDNTVNEPLKIAAKWDKQFKNFKKLPRGLIMKNEEKIETTEEEKVETTEETKVEEQAEEKPVEEQKPVEEKKEEELAEEPDQEDIEELRKTIEILKEENESLKSQLADCQKKLGELEEKKETKEEEEKEEVLTKAQVDKRVSGIQASMQKQINDFKSQLEAREEELKSAKADITRLNESLDKAARELSETASILDEKTQALERLNSSVNGAAEELPTMEEGLAKCASPSEKVEFLKSGRYIRVR